MTYALQRGLSAEQTTAAARLYWLAFGSKLGRVMGPEPQALAFIARVMEPSHALGALDAQGRLVGVIGYRTPRGSFVGGTKSDLVAVYGRFGAWWRSLALGVLATDLRPGEMCIDGISVAEAARGQGVGAALVEALAIEARGRGYHVLRLEVVGENMRARALYHRLGFEVVGRSDRRLTAWLFNFRSCHTMERRL